MQMGARAPAGTPGDADLLTGDDVLAAPNEWPVEMCIERRIAASVRNRDEVSVALVPAHVADLRHHASGGSSHLQRTQDPDVDARVPTAAVIAEW